MERIVIEVEDATAEKWRNVPQKIKNRLEEIFVNQIDMLAEDRKIKEFLALRDRISDYATQQGLTEEILEKLLNEE